MYDELAELLFDRRFEELEKRLTESGWDRAQEDPSASLLWAACISDNSKDFAEWLLSHGFKANPATVRAAIAGDGDASVVALLLQGMTEDERNAKDARGWNALYLAVEEGICTYTVMEGADEALRQSELTRSCDIIEVLIAAGVRVNEKNKDGRTPLHLCALTSPFYDEAHVTFASLLMKHGADAGVTDNKGRTPLDIAHEYMVDRVIAVLTAH